MAAVKGPWAKEEDDVVIRLVGQYGPKRWSLIASNLPGRTGKQCRERWHNQLDPNIKKEGWSEEEDRVLLQSHLELGNHWVEISKRLPGRTDNAIKNRWNSTMRKRAMPDLLDNPTSILLQVLPRSDATTTLAGLSKAALGTGVPPASTAPSTAPGNLTVTRSVAAAAATPSHSVHKGKDATEKAFSFSSKKAAAEDAAAPVCKKFKSAGGGGKAGAGGKENVAASKNESHEPRAQVPVVHTKSGFKGKKRQLGDSKVETLEGGGGAGSLASSSPCACSPYVQDDEDDDFKSTADSDDESHMAHQDVHPLTDNVCGIASSPMLDDSIMSNNVTLALESRTPSSWAFKSVFGLSKNVTSTIKKANGSATSSPGHDSRRLSSSFLGSAMKGGTPLTLHGLTPGNFSPSAFFLEGSPSANANLSALKKSALSATGSKVRGILSPAMSDLKEVRRPINFTSPSVAKSCIKGAGGTAGSASADKARVSSLERAKVPTPSSLFLPPAPSYAQHVHFAEHVPFLSAQSAVVALSALPPWPPMRPPNPLPRADGPKCGPIGSVGIPQTSPGQ